MTAHFSSETRAARGKGTASPRCPEGGPSTKAAYPATEPESKTFSGEERERELSGDLF